MALQSPEKGRHGVETRRSSTSDVPPAEWVLWMRKKGVRRDSTSEVESEFKSDAAVVAISSR